MFDSFAIEPYLERFNDDFQKNLFWEKDKHFDLIRDFILKEYKIQIDKDTGIYDLATEIKVFEVVTKVYNQKKAISPNWENALIGWIRNIVTIVDDIKEDHPRSRPFDRENVLLSFNSITAGENPTFYNIGFRFIYNQAHYERRYFDEMNGWVLETKKTELPDKNGFSVDRFNAIMEGIQYAWLLPQLNDELDKIVNPRVDNTASMFASPMPKTKIELAEIDAKPNKPIQLDMEQRQIIYLFQKLIDNKFINKVKNPNLWDLVAKTFTDKDGKPLNNIHQNKDGLIHSKTGKPKKDAEKIEGIVNDVNDLE